MDPRTAKSSTAKSAPTEYQDALTFLTADHLNVTDLFEQFQTSMEDETQSEERQELAESIFRELEIHTEIEEEIFYPAVAREASLKTLVEEALQQHAEVKSAIQTLRNLDIDDAEYFSTMMQMIEDVEHHIEEEENIMFPEVERHFEEELTELGARMEERKQELLAASPSPKV